MSESSSCFLILQKHPWHRHLRQQAAQLLGTTASANRFSIGPRGLSSLAGVMPPLRGDQGSAPARGSPLPSPSAKAAREAPRELPALLSPCGSPRGCWHACPAGTHRRARAGQDTLRGKTEMRGGGKSAPPRALAWQPEQTSEEHPHSVPGMSRLPLQHPALALIQPCLQSQGCKPEVFSAIRCHP